MMARYIDADGLYRRVKEKTNPYGKPTLDYESGIRVLNIIKDAPTADVEEVRHGEWELKSEIHRFLEEFDEEFYVECPLCHRVEYIPFEFEEEKMLKYAKENYPYCHCGAKMDGKRKEKNDFKE